MNTTTKNMATIKTAVRGALNGRAATAEVVCFRLGLIVNRPNLRVVRAALGELRAAKQINSHIVGGSQDVAYHV
jgi:hypothetical protein